MTTMIVKKTIKNGEFITTTPLMKPEVKHASVDSIHKSFEKMKSKVDKAAEDINQALDSILKALELAESGFDDSGLIRKLKSEIEAIENKVRESAISTTKTDRLNLLEARQNIVLWLCRGESPGDKIDKHIEEAHETGNTIKLKAWVSLEPSDIPMNQQFGKERIIKEIIDIDQTPDEAEWIQSLKNAADYYDIRRDDMSNGFRAIREMIENSFFISSD